MLESTGLAYDWHEFRTTYSDTYQEQIPKQRCESGGAYWHWLARAERFIAWLVGWLPSTDAERLFWIVEDFVPCGFRRKQSLNSAKMVAYVCAYLHYVGPQFLMARSRVFVLSPSDVERWLKNDPDRQAMRDYFSEQRFPQTEHESDALRLCLAFLNRRKKGILNVL